MFEKEDSGKIYFMEENRKALTKIILTITTMKYHRKGYDAYLAVVVDIKKEEVE